MSVWPVYHGPVGAFPLCKAYRVLHTDTQQNELLWSMQPLYEKCSAHIRTGYLEEQVHFDFVLAPVALRDTASSVALILLMTTQKQSNTSRQYLKTLDGSLPRLNRLHGNLFLRKEAPTVWAAAGPDLFKPICVHFLNNTPTNFLSKPFFPAPITCFQVCAGSYKRKARECASLVSPTLVEEHMAEIVAPTWSVFLQLLDWSIAEIFKNKKPSSTWRTGWLQTILPSSYFNPIVIVIVL